MSKQVRVLYVDDEPINLMMFKMSFQDEADISTSKSGNEALDLLKKDSDFEIIISDMRMPEMDGLTFINKAKDLKPDGQYFLMTGYDLTEDIEQALEANLIKQYFQKPFKREELLEVISRT